MSDPAQPNQPQYGISALNLFPVWANRSAYSAANGGKQAPPFNPSNPVKFWADPAPPADSKGMATYWTFDPKNAANGYVNSLVIPATLAGTLNMPGAYNYPGYVEHPTDAVQYGPFGPIGTANPNQVCMQADAQEVGNEIAAFFPGIKPVVSLFDTPYKFVYGQDPRRQWRIVFGQSSFLAQTLIEAKNYHGVGAPGHWALDANGGLNWIYDPPVIAAPPGSQALAVPIRALLANEKIVQIHPVNSPLAPFAWVVERTDMQQPQPPETADQQFADIKAMLSKILAKVGG